MNLEVEKEIFTEEPQKRYSGYYTLSTEIDSAVTHSLTLFF